MSASGAFHSVLAGLRCFCGGGGGEQGAGDDGKAWAVCFEQRLKTGALPGWRVGNERRLRMPSCCLQPVDAGQGPKAGPRAGLCQVARRGGDFV